MATLADSQSFLVSVRIDGSGYQNFTYTPLPPVVPGSVRFANGETHLATLATLSWNGYPEGVLVEFVTPGANGLAVLDDRSDILDLDKQERFGNIRYPLFRWQLIPNDLSSPE